MKVIVVSIVYTLGASKVTILQLAIGNWWSVKEHFETVKVKHNTTKKHMLERVKQSIAKEQLYKVAPP